MNLKQAKELVRSRLSDKRYEHTINVKKMAVKLAKIYGEDEERAALAALCPKPAAEETCPLLPPQDPTVTLSVIVPVYNGEATIGPCLDSILQQETSCTVQLIVVDSDSTDGTAAVLERYRALPGVLLCNCSAPRSAAAARNEGLRHAVGRWLMFVDSDDLLLPGAIRTLLEAAQRLDADVVQGGWQYLYTDGTHGPVQRYPAAVYAGAAAPERFELPGMPWGKVYRRELFAQVRFPAYYTCFEDAIIHFLVFRLAKTVASVPEMVYLWRKNPKGLTATSQHRPAAVQSYWIMEQLLAQGPFYDLPDRLVDAANENGGSDNITALLLAVEPTEVHHG